MTISHRFLLLILYDRQTKSEPMGLLAKRAPSQHPAVSYSMTRNIVIFVDRGAGQQIYVMLRSLPGNDAEIFGDRGDLCP
jgi:hypothetical protein